jgi:vacuolar protein sorting-associated protein 26
MLTHTQRYPFEFATVDKPYETYTGLNVRLRYFLRATVTTKTAYLPNIVAEQDLLVQTTTEVRACGESVCVCVCVEGKGRWRMYV